MKYGTNLVCLEDCSEFNYEHNGWCYSDCPENENFCKPTTIIIETTNNYISTTNNDMVHSITSEINNLSTNKIIEGNNLNGQSTNINIIPTTDVKEQLSSQEKKSDNINTNDNSSENIINENSFESNEEIYQDIINNIIKNSEDKDQLIEGVDNFIFHISTPDNEKKSLREMNNNNISNQVSKIDLGFCEDILKEHYNIEQNDSLIIIKFQKITIISKERSLQYEVYEPYNKTKLNLSLCDNTTINLYIPLILSDELQDLYNQLKDLGYNLFDINDKFYQDICTPFTTPNGTDILLEDRITYYFHNNETICQSNCEFSDYSFESQFLKCDCDTSNSKIDTKETTKFKPKILYESFYDILKYSNYKVLYCYKLAFHINSVTINKGSIIAIIYFCVYLVFFGIYCYEGIKRFKLYVAKKVLNYPVIPNNNNDINIASKMNLKIFGYKNSSIQKELNNDIIKNVLPHKKKAKSITLQNRPKTTFSKNNKKNSKNFNKQMTEKNIMLSNKADITGKFQKDKLIEKKKNEINKDNKEEKLDNFELNDLDYESAIRLDKRNLIQIYWSLLRREHIIIFTFFERNDYNLILIKFCRFLFLLCTDMSMNVFFFSDETMHKMYLDYGKYNFIQQFAQIAFSTLATQLIEVLICYLSLTDKHYYEIKNLEKDEKHNLFSILECIKRKIAVFFFITFLMLAFHWYTIACFCAVYPNTQKAFLLDSFSSFLLGLLYPFILYLFPALLRFIALKAKHTNLSCIYSFSGIIPFF